MSFAVTKTYDDGTDLTEQQLDDAFQSIETLVNTTKLGTDNLQASSVDSTILAANSVTTAKIAAANVTYAKLGADITALLVPTGSLLPFGGESAPAGFLICDGSSVSRTTYSALFGVIGSKYGTADGTTFNLPDMRGRFLRGFDNGAGNDPDAASRTASNTGGATGDNLGTLQGHAFQTHTHIQDSHTHNSASSFSVLTGVGSNVSGGSGFSIGQVNPVTATVTPTNQDAAASGSTAQASANETRPVNVTVNFIIKT